MFTKIDSRMFKDSKVMSLSSNEKVAFFYLLGNERRNMAGFYRIDKFDMMRFIGISKIELLQAIEAIERAGIILFDRDKEVVFIKNFLKYNQAISEQQIKGTMARLDDTLVNSRHFIPFLSYLCENSESVRLAFEICKKYDLFNYMQDEALRVFSAHGLIEFDGTNFMDEAASGFEPGFLPEKNEPANMNNINVKRERAVSRDMCDASASDASCGLGSVSKSSCAPFRWTEGHRVYGGESVTPPDQFSEGQGDFRRKAKKGLHSAPRDTGAPRCVPPRKEKSRVGDWKGSLLMDRNFLLTMRIEERMGFVDKIVKSLGLKKAGDLFNLHFGLMNGWVKATKNENGYDIKVSIDKMMIYLSDIWTEVDDMDVNELRDILARRIKAMNPSRLMIFAKNYVEQMNANGSKLSSPAAFLSSADFSKYVSQEWLESEAEAFFADFRERINSQEIYEKDREDFISYALNHIDISVEGYGASLARLATDSHPTNKVKKVGFDKELDFRDTRLINCLLFTLGARYLELKGEDHTAVYDALKSWWSSDAGNPLSTFEFICQGGYREFCAPKVDLKFNPFSGEQFEPGIFDGDELGSSALKMFEAVVKDRGIEFLSPSTDEFVDWGFR